MYVCKVTKVRVARVLCQSCSDCRTGRMYELNSNTVISDQRLDCIMWKTVIQCYNDYVQCEKTVLCHSPDNVITVIQLPVICGYCHTGQYTEYDCRTEHV